MVEARKKTIAKSKRKQKPKKQTGVVAQEQILQLCEQREKAESSKFDEKFENVYATIDMLRATFESFKESIELMDAVSKIILHILGYLLIY